MPSFTYNPVPSVEPASSAGAPFQNIRATPQAFGAEQGAALQQLGQRFEQAGDALAVGVVTRQNLLNQVTADDYLSKAQEAANKLMYGDPDSTGDTGFRGLKGEAAMREFPNVRKNIDKVLQEHRAALQNPVQQHLFDREMRRSRLLMLNEMGRHYDQEVNRHTESVYKGRMKTSETRMSQAAAAGDDDKFEREVASQIADAVKYGTFTGKSKEETDAEISRITANAVETKAERLMAENPLAAKKFLENNRERLSAEKVLSLEGRVKAAAIKQEGEDIAAGRPSRMPSNLVRGGATGMAAARSMEETLRGRGWSNAAITGAMNNALGESSLNPNARGPGDEEGFFQFHPKSHLPLYKAKYGNDWSPQAQANYMADVVEREMPGYKTITDTRTATAQFLRGFEKPKNQGEDEVNRRLAMNYQPGNTVANAAARGQSGINPPVEGKPPDQLILPPLDPGEVPDAEIPGLVARLETIAKDPRSMKDGQLSETGEYAVKKVRREFKDAHIEQQRRRQLSEQARIEQDRTLIREYQTRMASHNPPTINEVREDQRLSASAVADLTGQISRDTRPATEAALSAKNQRMISIRMEPDYEGEDKITSAKQIRTLYNNGELTLQDRDELLRDFDNLYDPTKPQWSRKINQVLKSVEAKMVPTLLMGRERAYAVDKEAGTRVQSWRRAAEDKIREYSEAGKNTSVLFQPGTTDKPNPEYIGGDAFLSPYAKSLGGKIADTKPLAGPSGNVAALARINAATTIAELNAVVAEFPLLRDAAVAAAIEKKLGRPRLVPPMAQ